MAYVEYFQVKVTPIDQTMGDVARLVPLSLSIDQHIRVLEYSKIYAKVVFNHAMALRGRRNSSVTQQDLEKLRQETDRMKHDEATSTLITDISELIMDRAREVTNNGLDTRVSQ